MESCPVCDGTGRLLADLCPLCEGLSEACSEGAARCSASESPGVATAIACAPLARGPNDGIRGHGGLCLVLDIDGTLLSEAANDCAHAAVENVSEQLRAMLRPHLQDFLDAAFASCGAVGLWTAASRDWLHVFLRLADPERQRPWAFTWSADRISLGLEGHIEGLYPVRTKQKRLRKIWRNKALRALGYTPRTTLIVDNTPSVCRHNYGNAIYIKTYGDEEQGEAATDSSDDHLLVLLAYLRELHDKACAGVSMRCVEKRCWYTRLKYGNEIPSDYVE